MKIKAYFFECSWVLNNSTRFALAFGATNSADLRAALLHWFSLERIDTLLAGAEASTCDHLCVWEVADDGTMARRIDLGPYVRVQLGDRATVGLRDAIVSEYLHAALEAAEESEDDDHEPDLQVLPHFRFQLDWVAFAEALTTIVPDPLGAPPELRLHRAAVDGDETFSSLEGHTQIMGWSRALAGLVANRIVPVA